MPRYYCDYCDTYLTHDSPSVRKQHNAGYKHKANVRAYYQQFEEQQTQSLIDQRIKEHLGQAAAFQQVGSVYAQHLAQRPRLPMIPPPILPIPGAASSPLVPGARPPIMPRPMPIPGYGGTAASLVGPPGASSLPMQMVNPQVPLPTMSAPTNVPVGMAAPSSNGAPSTGQQSMYQVNPTAPSSSGYDMNHNAANMSRPSGGAPPMSTGAGDGLGYARPTESNQ